MTNFYRALQRITVAVRSQVDMRRVLETFAADAGRLLDLSICALARWDESGEHLQFDSEFRRDAPGAPLMSLRGSHHRPGEDPAAAQFEALVLQDRRPYVHNGSSGSPSLGIRLLDPLGDASIVVVPLVADQLVVGLLAAARPPDLPGWSEEEIEFLRSAADITAVAMQHATMRSHVRALSASAAGISARATEHVLLKRLTEAAVSVTGSTMGTAGVRAGDQMVSRHLWHRGAWEAVEARFSSGQGLVGWCWSHRAPCIANDAVADPRTDSALVAAWGIRSALVLPILDPEGQVVGFMELCNRIAGAPYGAEEVSLASALSQHAGMALTLRRMAAAGGGASQSPPSKKARGSS